MTSSIGPGGIESLAPRRTSARSAEFSLSELPQELPPIRKAARHHQLEPQVCSRVLDNWLHEQAAAAHADLLTVGPRTCQSGPWRLRAFDPEGTSAVRIRVGPKVPVEPARCCCFTTH